MLKSTHDIVVASIAWVFGGEGHKDQDNDKQLQGKHPARFTFH
jgi:hypothetical protein